MGVNEVDTTDYDLQKKYFRKPEELLEINTRLLKDKKIEKSPRFNSNTSCTSSEIGTSPKF